MTHLPYIAGAYGIFLLLTLGLSIGATKRLSRASARLKVLDPRSSG